VSAEAVVRQDAQGCWSVLYEDAGGTQELACGYFSDGKALSERVAAALNGVRRAVAATIPLPVAVLDAATELQRAQGRYPPMHSAHEGWAVIREEYLELEEALRMRQGDPERPGRIRAEAIQVAAMALRLAADVCDDEEAARR
jgi:hypothetical protein